MKQIINCIYMMNLPTLSLYVSIDPRIDSPTDVQLRAVSHTLLFGVLSFGEENESFIGDWISINLFASSLSTQLVGTSKKTCLLLILFVDVNS